MYDICHPSYYNMSQLGCNDQVKLTTAFYVYMELCEIKRYWDVEYKYCRELELIYLQAKKKKNAPVDTFVPWPAVHNFSLDYVRNVQLQLGIDKFTFVFKEGDTTSAYYTVKTGIHKPSNPEESKLLKAKEEKKSQLEREITKNTSNLYKRALHLNNDTCDYILNGNKLSKNEETANLENNTAKQVLQPAEHLPLEELHVAQVNDSSSASDAVVTS